MQQSRPRRWASAWCTKCPRDKRSSQGRCRKFRDSRSSRPERRRQDLWRRVRHAARSELGTNLPSNSKKLLQLFLVCKRIRDNGTVPRKTSQLPVTYYAQSSSPRERRESAKLTTKGDVELSISPANASLFTCWLPHSSIIHLDTTRICIMMFQTFLAGFVLAQDAADFHIKRSGSADRNQPAPAPMVGRARHRRSVAGRPQAHVLARRPGRGGGHLRPAPARLLAAKNPPRHPLPAEGARQAPGGDRHRRFRIPPADRWPAHLPRRFRARRGRSAEKRQPADVIGVPQRRHPAGASSPRAQEHRSTGLHGKRKRARSEASGERNRRQAKRSGSSSYGTTP